jgi:hypothetical protein
LVEERQEPVAIPAANGQPNPKGGVTGRRVPANSTKKSVPRSAKPAAAKAKAPAKKTAASAKKTTRSTK